MESFGDRLVEAVKQKRTPVVVGIDPRAELLPAPLVARHGLGPGAGQRIWACAVEEFCSRVLEIVASRVPAVKFQSALFELHGAAGIASLCVLLRKARRLGLVTILDAKRGDIGSTSEAYAEAAFGKYSGDEGTGFVAGCDADALTVSPYLGRDSLEPFFKFARDAGRGLFVLVRTSNPGAQDLQHLRSSDAGQTIYQHVARWVLDWSQATSGRFGYGSVGAVVGGTARAQIAELRSALPKTWLLIPGYGAQGAAAADIAAAFDADGLAAIVNNSRGILFPNIEGDPSAAGAWERAVEAALKRMIDDLAQNTPAGRLRSK